MSQLYIVTVATNSKFYFEWLKESCKRNNKDLIVLGYGQKWKGYTWRFKLVMNYLNTLNDDDIICFVDGYDVICTRNLDELKDQFYKIKKENNCKLIVGVENYNILLQKKLSEFYFNKCNKLLLNAGTYIGTVKDIKEILSIAYSYNPNDNADDQVLLTQYCKLNPNAIYIDEKYEIFLVHHYPLNEIDNKLIIQNNSILYKSQKPFFLHVPSCTYLNNILIKLGYNINNKQIKKIKKDFISYIMSKTLFYIKQLFTKYLICSLLIILFILFYIKIRFFNYYTHNNR